MFHDRWKGCDLNNVKETWAEEPANFCRQTRVHRPCAEGAGIGQVPADLAGIPRSLPPGTAKGSGPCAYVPTAADEERARSAAAEAAKIVKKFNSDGIDTHWATHPKSVMHLKFIFDAAVRDQRCWPCIAEMVEGICTENGVLLKTFKDGQWWPVVRRAA